MTRTQHLFSPTYPDCLFLSSQYSTGPPRVWELGQHIYCRECLQPKLASKLSIGVSLQAAAACTQALIALLPSPHLLLCKIKKRSIWFSCFYACPMSAQTDAASADVQNDGHLQLLADHSSCLQVYILILYVEHLFCFSIVIQHCLSYCSTASLSCCQRGHTQQRAVQQAVNQVFTVILSSSTWLCLLYAAASAIVREVKVQTTALHVLYTLPWFNIPVLTNMHSWLKSELQ